MKYGIPGAGCEHDDATLFQVAHGAAANERFGDGPHLDRRRDSGRDAVVLERVLQRERVDHRRQHAHVVGCGPVHALGARREAAEQVAAADDNRRLDAERLNLEDVFGDLGRDRRIDSELLLAHQGFTGKLQQNALVGGSGHIRTIISSAA